MIDWTAVLTAVMPGLVFAAAVLAVAFMFRRHISRINTKWGSATMNGAGVSPAYLIELLWEVVEILEGRVELRHRRRALIRRYVKQWRHTVTSVISRELTATGIPTEGLYKNPIYRYLMSVLDTLSYKLVGVAMAQLESNDFEDLIDEKDREAFLRTRTDELKRLIEDAVVDEYIVSENALITQLQVRGWLTKNAAAVDMVWAQMYRELIDVTIQARSRLQMDVDRITLKGESSGVTEAQIDQIRNYMTRKLKETV